MKSPIKKKLLILKSEPDENPTGFLIFMQNVKTQFLCDSATLMEPLLTSVIQKINFGKGLNNRGVLIKKLITMPLHDFYVTFLKILNKKIHATELKSKKKVST